MEEVHLSSHICVRNAYDSGFATLTPCTWLMENCYIWKASQVRLMQFFYDN